MANSPLQSVQDQEKQAKPQLLPSRGLGDWLREQGGSLVFSTYQSSRIFFVSANEAGETVALERIVGTAMGLAVDRDRLWVTNKEQAWRFTNIGPRTFKPVPDQDAVSYDAVYMPRWGILLGGCDTHDVLANVKFNGRQHELLFVNTAFSCIASIDGHYNFVPVWKPPFISALSPEDRCHLNGMGAKEGQLAYATACAETDAGYAWKPQKNGGGLLIDVQANEIITRNLSMPHSPRWHNGKVWLLNSGDGQLGYVDPANGQFVPVADCPGFARGLHIVGDYAIVGLSKLRDNTFSSGLRIKQKLEDAHVPQRCGLLVISLKTGKVEHWLTIEGTITELYDVAFLPGIQRPYTPGFGQPELHRHAFNVPNDLAPVVAPTPVSQDSEAKTTEATDPADNAEPAQDTKQ
jgi:uncharacterized protein (TIGR03032 family)